MVATIYHRQRILLSILAACTLLTLVLLLQGTLTSPVHAASAATDYFASTTGSGTLCAMNQPCLITVALSLASDSDTIYVEQGTYTTTATSVVLVTNSITLYGGWDGSTSSPVTHNPKLYPTILDGEDSKRVILINSAVTPTIDGFIITRGNASNAATGQGQGGGIYSRYASPLISNNVISGNTADTSIILTGYGGGVYVRDAGAQTVITGNLIYSNVASLSHEGWGGGLHVESGTGSQQIVNNVILSNTASITGGSGLGGGISLFFADYVTVLSNTVEHNIGTMAVATMDIGNGGGIYCGWSDDITIAENTLQYNTASFNTDSGAGGISAQYCDRLSVANNTINYNISSDPGGSGRGHGGGVGLTHSLDVTLDRNGIISNTGYYGGGVYVGPNTSFTMTNNIVADNYADFRGGGLSIEASVDSPITGTLVHNTLAANNRGVGAGRNGINVPWSDTTLVLTNNIIITHLYGIAVQTGSVAQLDHTLFFNNTTDMNALGTITNTNAITGQNPLLDTTYHLMGGSPAIAAGTSLGWPELDIDGEPRRLRTPSLGADEYALPYQVYLPLTLKEY